MLAYISPSEQRRVLARAGPCLDHGLLLQTARCAVVVVGAVRRGVSPAEIERVRLQVERRVFVFQNLILGPRAARDGSQRSCFFNPIVDILCEKVALETYGHGPEQEALQCVDRRASFLVCFSDFVLIIGTRGLST